ncbi:thioredoxin-like protein [Neohortaea acidophila]|uniref:Thioredoxin-like protein n=1 Tax=Neohortaea acidophila TaxID=245834 RepID=A0A6A6PI05_9PEZI|nr:thioredoxin-like protein [Neohortaea acidophila]KAF2479650.1 thioredoxin-like protein [Neohortaea acidophila]
MNVFKNLFKETGVKDVITLFHSPSSQASTRIYTLLKQVSAQSSAHATEDQASDHKTQSKLERTDFELDVQEGAPTPDQLGNILEYLGPSKAGTLIKDATGGSDALRRFKQNEKVFTRPVVVDWNNGRAVVGDNESEIMKLVRSLPKETDKA